MVVELPPDLGVYWWRISAANMGQTRVFARIRQLFVYYLSVLIIYVLILLFSDLQHCFQHVLPLKIMTLVCVKELTVAQVEQSSVSRSGSVRIF